MKRKALKERELIVVIVSRFYLFLAILHLLFFDVFSKAIHLFGHKLNHSFAILTGVLYAIFLYFLYDSIKRQKITGLFFALTFQLFFIINNIQMLIGKTPFLSVKSERIVFIAAEKYVIVFSVIVSAIITGFLLYCLYMPLKKTYKKMFHHARKTAKPSRK